MGCGGSKNGNDSLARPQSNQIVVYGDYYNCDTRTVLAILEIARIPYKFENVSVLNLEHQNESYKAINPSGHIPLITEGGFKILGGGIPTIQYLVNAHKSVADALHPEAQRKEIDSCLNWFQYTMRKETQTLIRMIVPAKVLGGNPPSAKQKQDQKDTIFGKGTLLSTLNNRISRLGTPYLICDKMTVVDVQIYCEVSTVIQLTQVSNEELKQNFPEFAAWYNLMKGVSQLQQLDSKLAEIVAKFNLAEQ